MRTDSTSREECSTHKTYSFQSPIAGVKQEDSRLVRRHRGILQVLIESHQLGCQRIVRSTVRGHDSEVPRERITRVTHSLYPMLQMLPPAPFPAPLPLSPCGGDTGPRLTRRAGARAARCAPAAPPRPPRPRRSWPGRPPEPAAAGWRGAGASPPPRHR